MVVVPCAAARGQVCGDPGVFQPCQGQVAAAGATWSLFWLDALQGGPYKNRKQGEQLGPQGAVNVHAALNHWVRRCCTEAGVTVFNLTEDSGYQALYKSYTKHRNGNRKTLVPINFTRDHYIKLVTHLFKSNSPDAVRVRMMVLLACSAVARGDEIRDVRLSSLAVEHIDIIGELMASALTSHIAALQATWSRFWLGWWWRWQRRCQCTGTHDALSLLLHRSDIALRRVRGTSSSHAWREYLLYICCQYELMRPCGEVCELELP